MSESNKNLENGNDMRNRLMSVSRERECANVIAHRRVLQNQSVWPVRNDQTDETESKSEIIVNAEHTETDLKLEITENSNLKEMRKYIRKHKLKGLKTLRQNSKKTISS